MLIRIIISGVFVCLICMIIRKINSEFILPIELVFVCFAVCAVIGSINEITESLSEMYDKSGFNNDVMSSLVKGGGICMLTKISSDISRENGNMLISDIVELTGRIMLVIIALPYVQAVIGIASAFVK